jgi:hypothetical protein
MKKCLLSESLTLIEMLLVEKHPFFGIIIHFHSSFRQLVFVLVFSGINDEYFTSKCVCELQIAITPQLCHFYGSHIVALVPLWMYHHFYMENTVFETKQSRRESHLHATIHLRFKKMPVIYFFYIHNKNSTLKLCHFFFYLIFFYFDFAFWVFKSFSW